MNPLVIEKATLDAEVSRLTRLQSQHRDTQFKLRYQIRHAEEEIPRIEQRLAAVQQDITARQDTRGDAFSIEIEGQTYTDRGTAGELINRKAQRVRATGRDERVGHFAGFAILLARNPMERVDLVIKGATTHFANVSDSPLGTIRSLEHTVQSFEQVGNDCTASMQATQKRLKDLNEQIGQPFEYAEDLAETETATDPHRAARLEQESSGQHARCKSGGGGNRRIF